jgi:hypothetical protein
MATIKRAGNRIITKVVNGQRRVSCSCCCFCSNYDLDDVYGSERLVDDFLLLVEEAGDQVAFDNLRPDNRNWRQKDACLRWLCRRVVLVDGSPVVISHSLGGPTTNDRDLNELVMEGLGEVENKPGLARGGGQTSDEEYGRCYLYEFSFYGWGLRAGEWISSDLLYMISRADEGPPAL